jgi:hypothetical protein
VKPAISCHATKMMNEQDQVLNGDESVSGLAETTTITDIQSSVVDSDNNRQEEQQEETSQQQQQQNESEEQSNDEQHDAIVNGTETTENIQVNVSNDENQQQLHDDDVINVSIQTDNDDDTQQVDGTNSTTTTTTTTIVEEVSEVKRQSTSFMDDIDDVIEEVVDHEYVVATPRAPQHYHHVKSLEETEGSIETAIPVVLSPHQQLYCSTEKNMRKTTGSDTIPSTASTASLFHKEQERLVNGEWSVLHREYSYQRSENVEFFMEMEENSLMSQVDKLTESFIIESSSSTANKDTHSTTSGNTTPTETPEVAITAPTNFHLKKITNTMSQPTIQQQSSQQLVYTMSSSDFEKTSSKSTKATPRFRLFSNPFAKTPPSTPPEASHRQSHQPPMQQKSNGKEGRNSAGSENNRSSLNTSDTFFEKLQKWKSESQQSSPSQQQNRRDSRTSMSGINDFADKGISQVEIKDVPPLTSNISKKREMYLKDDTRLMSVHDPGFTFIPKEVSVCHRGSVISDPYGDKGQMYLFSTKSLDLKNGLWEPLFCSVYLYDLRLKQRVSSSFNFHVNTPSELSMMDSTVREKYEKTLNKTNDFDKTAVFRIKHPNPYIYLVVWVERVFQGNLKRAYKVYQKGGKDQEKMKRESKETIKITSHFREPFIFGFSPLFKVTRKIIWDDETGDEKAIAKLVPFTDNTIQFFKSQGLHDILDFFDSTGHIPSDTTASTDPASRFNTTDIQKMLDKKKKEKDLKLEWASMKFEFPAIDETNITQFVPSISCSNKFELEEKLQSICHMCDTLPVVFPHAPDGGPVQTYIEYPISPAVEIRNTVFVYLDSLEIHSLYGRSYAIQTYLRLDDKMSTNPVKCIHDPYNRSQYAPYALSSVTHANTYVVTIVVTQLSNLFV